MMNSVRLQKYLARCGVASRRHSEELIVAGRVLVNGEVATLGQSIDPELDTVTVDGEAVDGVVERVTLMLNKPAGYVTSMNDDQGRADVSELVPLDSYPGLFPLGRLDADTTGLLLFSTDGELGQALMHPRQHVDKTYRATVEGVPTEAELNQLRRGVVIDGRKTYPAEVEMVSFEAPHDGDVARRIRPSKGSAVLRITIHEGRNRQIRKMCRAVGHNVIGLHRESLGSLTLGDLPEGQWRLLNADEIASLVGE